MNLIEQIINIMAEFFPQERISNPEKIFGRESDIRELISATETKTQLQIIGARRFGKTTISLCIESYLRNDKGSNVYPLYIDVKKARIKGTANFYRFLTASLVARLYEDNLFRSKQRFGTISIRPNGDYLTIYTALLKEPDTIMDDLFISVTKQFAERINKSILVIFDEFEYLAKTTFFDNLDGFYPLREFSQDRLDSGLRPFFFWLVGARPWGVFVRENKLSKVDVIGGSGEFNGVEIELYLSPIDKASFLSFWQARCEEYYGRDLSEDVLEEKNYFISLGERVFNAVSGVPFYGSAIAKHIKSFKSFPDYSSIKSHIEEALGIFDDCIVSYMRALCTPRIVMEDDDKYKLLSRYGFIRKLDDGSSCISMGFFRDYLINKMPLSNTPVNNAEQNDVSDLINNLVNELYMLINSINESFRAKKGKFVFETPNQKQVFDDDKTLRKVCKSSEDFGDLLSVVYLMYYERTKAIRTDTGTMQVGQRLFEVEKSMAYRNRIFFKIIEPLRAAYSTAHIAEKLERHTELGQLDHYDAMEKLKGNRNPPEDHEWPTLQIKILKLFKKELEIIKTKAFAL